MIGRWHFVAASWTLVNQAIVSAGGLLINVMLARQLPPAEYGIFALLYGGMLTLQLFNATLLFHPLSVRLPVAPPAGQARLLRCTLLLTLGLSLLLSVPLGLLLTLSGHGVLAPAALCCFLSWQLQEAMRRGMLCSFRHRQACLGDAVSYLGQVAVALLLAQAGLLRLESALYGLAATSALAALIQGWQLRPGLEGGLDLRRTMADFWVLGGFWSLGNGLLSVARLQMLPWFLALNHGPAAAAALAAAGNVVNLSNPVIMGLCNIIPSAAARAHRDGHAAAWRAARGFMLLAVPPLAAYAVLLLAFPGWMLRLFYGASSGYADEALVVQILVLASLAGQASELIIAFLHGIGAAPRAFILNVIGTSAGLAVVWPLVGGLGLEGAGLTLIVANLVRLAASRPLLRTMAVAEVPQRA